MTRVLVRLAGAAALMAVACASPAAPAVTPTAPTTPAVSSTHAPTPTLAPVPTPTSTLEPASTPTPAPPWTPAGAPEYCVAPEKGQPQDIVGTPAAPYFVRHPTEDNPNTPTIVFLGGGSGYRRSAQRIWANYLSGGTGVDAFRVSDSLDVQAGLLVLSVRLVDGGVFVLELPLDRVESLLAILRLGQLGSQGVEGIRHLRSRLDGVVVSILND